MARDKITEYSSTASENTVVGDVNIAENSALPSDMNNAVREVLSHLKEGLGSGTPLYVDQTNNRVGINKTPTVALDVSGDADLSGTLDVTGTVTAGAVGIGESSPLARLHLKMGGSTRDDGFYITRDTNDNHQLGLWTSGGVMYFDAFSDNPVLSGQFSLRHSRDTGSTTTESIRASDTNVVINEGSVDMDFRVESDNNTHALFVEGSSGNVGIGNASPATKLDVLGNNLIGTFAGTDTASAYISFKYNTSTTSAFIGNGSSVLSGANNSDFIIRSQGDLVFASNGNNRRVTIDSSGRVAIGTTTVGETSADDLTIATTGQTGITIRSGTANAGSIYFSDATSGVGQYSGFMYYDHNTNFLAMGTNSIERMRIDSSGRLLVGNTGYNIGQDGVYLQTAGSVFSRNTTSGATQINFANPNSVVGSISTSGTSTSYNTSSDHRLKENVTADWDATTRLKQLNPVRFNFIADADTTVDGFLAHEVQSVVPEAISGTHNEVDADGNAVMQGIDQSKIVPLLVKTIQELEARITALENGV